MASQFLALSKQDSLLTVGVSALAAHFVFNRWEPLHPLPVSTLLVAIPAALSTLLSPYYGSLYALLLTFALYHTTLLSSIAIYRLSPFHPYARYPGPIPAKLSMFWISYMSTNGHGHQYISQLHEKYGDVVRTGPNEISIRDASAILPMMGAQGLTKGPMWQGLNFHSPNPALIALRNPTLHQSRRKPWNRAFSTLANKEYTPIIIKRAVQLVDRLSEQKGVTDIAQWFGFFTYDFMSDVVFGGGTEMLRDGDNQGLWRSLKDALRVQTVFERVPWLSYYAKHIPFLATESKQFRNFCMDRGTKRLMKGSEHKDLFYYLSNEDGAEKVNPSAADIITNSALAVIAGSDTTSTTLSNMFVSILQQPHYYKRLQEEVDRFYPAGEDATNPQHHSKMVFMEACINEALRLYPVVPNGSQRAPTPGAGGKVIGQYYIPEGHQARIHFWSVHRDPRNFTHPTTFFPERWLIADGLEAPPAGTPEPFVHNRAAFVPFSFGPANCVGKNMALLEMRIVVCHLMQRLNVRLADGWDPAEWDRGVEERFTLVVGRLPVVVTPRC